MRDLHPVPGPEAGRSLGVGRWAFAVISAGFLALHARYLIYPDLNLAYPFVGNDGYDWISNALAITGEPVRYTARPPLLPLLLAGLEIVGWTRLFPQLQLALLWLLLNLLHNLGGDLAKSSSSLAVSLAALTCAPLLWLGLEVMAEVPALLLLTLATRSFLLAGHEPRRLRSAGIWAGLSLLTQPVGLLILPIAALAVAIRRPHDLRHPAFLQGALACVALPAGWEAVKLTLLGSAGDIGNPHWGLVHWGPERTTGFAISVVSFFGWPLLLLAILGLTAAVRARDRRPLALLAGGWIGACSLFFGAFYDWSDRRFAVYLAVPILLLAAVGLAALARRARLAALTLALLAPLCAALPVSTAPTSTLLWPLPPIAWNLRPGATDERFASVPWSNLFANTPLTQVVSTSHSYLSQPPADSIDPRTFRQDDSAVYLFPVGSPPANPQVLQDRLGNALRLRARLIDTGRFSDAWWRIARLEPLTPADRYALFRFRYPGLARSWIVVTERGSAEAARLEGLASLPPLDAPRTEVLAAVERATRLSSPVRPRDALLAVFRPAEVDPEWIRLLPFVARTSAVFLLSPAEVPGITRDLTCELPILAAEARWTVRRCRWRGWKVFVVRESAD